MRWFHRVLKWSLLLGAVTALAAAVGIGFLWVKSPGTAQPFLDSSGDDSANAISSIEELIIGGVNQTIIIRGKNAAAPVMLFLHGGPGSPEYAFFRARNRGLEDDFVMVYWEQRGAGKSFDPDIDPATLSIEQMVFDAVELSSYLSQRFEKEKIFLMGHSWGSALALLTAQSRPDLFDTVFTVGQIATPYEGERLSFEWVSEQAVLREDSKAIETLSSMTLPEVDASAEEWISFAMVERGFVEQYGGGSTHEPMSSLALAGMVFAAPEYTLSEKLNYMKASEFSLHALWPELISTNLVEIVPALDVPVVIMHGRHDMTTPHSLAVSYFELLSAPEKHFYTFENSAHGVIFEEPERFNGVVRQHSSKE